MIQCETMWKNVKEDFLALSGQTDNGSSQFHWRPKRNLGTTSTSVISFVSVRQENTLRNKRNIADGEVTIRVMISAFYHPRNIYWIIIVYLSACHFDGNNYISINSNYNWCTCVFQRVFLFTKKSLFFIRTAAVDSRSNTMSWKYAISWY